MKTKHAFRMAVTAALLAGAFAARAGTTASPTKLSVKLYKTELHDGTSWTNIFSDANGVAVDLVTDAGAAFGHGEVPVGNYGKVRFTVANAITYSADAVSAGADSCAAVTDGTVRIDGAQGASAQVTLAFATAANGGNTDWYANGTEANPLLMTAPIEVQEGQTTKVTLQFQTQDTVRCSGSTVSVPDAPAMSVRTLVVPTTSPFAGGTYWFTHYNSAQWADDGFGNRIDPVNGTSVERALYRTKAGFYLGWGAKVTFGPAGPDGAGTVTLSGTMHENRRNVDETSCQDCGIISNTMDGASFPYTIDAQHRITILTDKGASYGGFNEDFSVFVGVSIEGNGNIGQDLWIGVKQSGIQSLTGLYSNAMAIGGFQYPVVNDVRQPLMSLVQVESLFGWARFDPDGAATDLFAYDTSIELTNPGALPGTDETDFKSYFSNFDVAGAMLPSEMAVGADGSGSFSIPDFLEGWIAADQGGRTVVLAGDTGEYDRSSSADAKYLQWYGIMLKQAPAGTQSLATVKGTWVFVARDDKLVLAGEDDGFVRKGSTYGVMKTDLAGIASFELTQNEDGMTRGEAGVGDLQIAPACIGSTKPFNGTDGRLSWALSPTDCAAAGGRMMDVGVLTAPDGTSGSKAVAWFVFNEDASVAALVSPDGFDTSDPDRNRNHMVGYAVHVAN